MEDQIPQSQTFQVPPQMPAGFTQEQVEQMKARAKEAAIRMAAVQSLEQRQQPIAPPQYVYVRRNLTVAELIVVFLIACGIVTGVQVGWNFAAKTLPRIEIKVK